MAAPALVPLPRKMHLLVQLMPPPEAAGTNLEQHFGMTVADVLPNPGDRCSVGATVCEVAARCATPQQVLKHIQTRDPSVTGITIARNARDAPPNTMNVPVMMHRQGQVCVLKLTARDAETHGVRWRANISTALPPECADAARASTWDVAGLTRRVSYDAMASETTRYEGNEVRVRFQSDDEKDVMIELVLQRAVNAASGEPLTFYGDRVWALRKIGIVAPRAAWGL